MSRVIRPGWQSVPPKDGPRAFIFYRRLSTPPRPAPPCSQLMKQLDAREKARKKQAAEKQFWDRMELFQIQRDKETGDREEQEFRESEHRKHMAALRAQDKYKRNTIPDRVTPPTSPVFGKEGDNPERRAYLRNNILEGSRQNHTVGQLKQREKAEERYWVRRDERWSIRKNQRETLDSNKNLMADEARRRENLVANWRAAVLCKTHRDSWQRLQHNPGGSTLDQMQIPYARCAQCQRCASNLGQSHIYMDTQFDNGSKLFV